MSIAKYPQMRDVITPGVARLRRRLPELLSFGGVGALAFIVDVGIYNVLRFGPMSNQIITAKVISVALATIVAWLGNRYLTFRARRGRPVLREAVLFGVSNVIGLAISALCLFVSHYLLGFTTPLADNIAGNVVGLVLGTTFRYFAYRSFVFRTPTGDPHDELALLPPSRR
ncbi:GtrA family protein [Glaciihabitans sp. UYNi722]|uniref:GtrA family protein n=1 Tax=Glaciihabitans sp. UYNi722 TaxID=3156344 RepID=UPI00339777C5